MATLPPWLRERGVAIAALVVAVGLAVYAAHARAEALFASPYPVGIDGYFYPVQLRSLFEDGALYYPSSPLAVWLMAPLAWLTDPITGAKLGAAIGTAAGVVPAYYLGRRLGGDRGLGLLAAGLWATSAESFYLSAEFVKNGIGLTLAASFLAALSWALDAPSRRRLALAAIALVATLLTHKQAFAFAVVLGAAPVAVCLHQRGVSWRAMLAVVAAGALAALGLGVVWPDRFLGARDLELVGALFTRAADITVPVLDPRGPAVLRFGHEALMAGVLGLAVVALAAAGRRVTLLGAAPGRAHDRALGLAAAAVAIALALPWIDVSDPQGLGFRLRLVAFVPLVLCAAAAAGRALGGLSGLTRAGLVLGFAVGWVASRPPTSTEGLVTVEGHMQAAVRAVEAYVPADEVVICPQRSLVFMITWYTGLDARLRPDEIEPARRWRLLPSRMVHRDLMRAIESVRGDRSAGVPAPIGLHPRHENGVVLMPEATWRVVMERAPARVRQQYRRWLTI